MSNGNGNDISKFTKWIKLFSYIVVVVATIGGIIWKADATFAKKEYVKERFAANQIEIVQTFQQVQKQFDSFRKQQNIQFYQRELRKLNDQHITIERRLSTQPNNPVLKEERQRIINNKRSMQQELDRLMR